MDDPSQDRVGDDRETAGRDHDRLEHDTTGARPTPLTQQVGRVALLLVAIVFGVFAVANSQPVDFSWLIGGTEVVEQGGERVSGGVPLIVLMLASFTAGALVATLLWWQRHRHHR